MKYCSKRIISYLLVVAMLFSTLSISFAANTQSTGTLLNASSIDFPLTKKQVDGLNLSESYGKIAGKGNTIKGMQINLESSSATFVMLPDFVNDARINTIVVNATNEYKVYNFKRALRAGDIVVVDTEGLGNNKNKLSQVGSIEFFRKGPIIPVDDLAELPEIEFPAISDSNNIHTLDVAGLQFSATSSNEDGDWHIIEASVTSKYTISATLNGMNTEARLYDSRFALIVPENGIYTLREGVSYYFNIDASSSSQNYSCKIEPIMNIATEQWSYSGFLVREAPYNWIAVTPEVDGAYTVSIDDEDSVASAIVWEWDNGLTQAQMDDNGNYIMQRDKSYYVEVDTGISDFIFVHYIVTLQLFEEDNEDEDEYPDDEDYNYNGYDPSEFEYDLDNENADADDDIPEGDYDEGIEPEVFAVSNSRGDENLPAENVYEKPLPGDYSDDDHSECDHNTESGFVGIQPMASGQYSSGRDVDFTDGFGTYYPATTWHKCTSFHPANYNGTKFKRSGYTQIGWVGITTGRAYYFGSSSVDFTYDYRWVAIWQPTTATLTYNIGKSTSGTVPASTTISFGGTTTVAPTTNLQRTGFLFYCWNTKSNGLGLDYFAGSKITLNENVTLYPKWQGTVIYVSEGAEGGTPPPMQTFTSGNKVSLNENTGNLTKAGYDFAGWIRVSPTPAKKYTNLSKAVAFSKSVTLRPYFKAQKKTVTFVAGEGTTGNAPTPQSFTVNKLFYLKGPGTLRKPGYKFAGWADDDGKLYTKRTQFSKDVTVYATWIDDGKTITYSSRYATGGKVPAPQSFIANEEVTLVAPDTLEKTGYVLTGWKKGTTDYYDGKPYTFKSSVTLYPVWERQEFTLTYYENGGEGETPEDKEFKGGQSIKLNGNTGKDKLWKEHFKFTGWNTEENAWNKNDITWGSPFNLTGVHYKAGELAKFAKDTELYAEWMPILYGVMYDANGGEIVYEGNPPITQLIWYSSDEHFAMDNQWYSKEGYIFDHWNTMPDDSGDSYGFDDTLDEISGNIVLYAIWEEVDEDEGVVTYVANGAAKMNIPTQDKYYLGDEFDLPYADDLEWEGYELVGWCADPFGKGKIYKPEQVVKSSSKSLILYAQWKLK